MSSNWSIAQFYEVIDFYKAKEILRKSTLLYFVQFVYQRSSQQKIGQNQHSHSDTDSESFGFQQSTPEVHGSNPVFRDINLNIYFLLIGLKIKNKRPEWTIFNTT